MKVLHEFDDDVVTAVLRQNSDFTAEVNAILRRAMRKEVPPQPNPSWQADPDLTGKLYESGLAIAQGTVFQVPELFLRAIGDNWGDVPAVFRKQLGKRFGNLVVQRYNAAATGSLVIQRQFPNDSANHANYAVQIK
jgi:hypothetical protein